MKYKLINRKTNEETICNKVFVDGIDYYVSDNPKADDYCLNIKTNEFFKVPDKTYVEGLNKNTDDKKVIATTNPNMDIPKVVDEVDELAALKYPNENPKNITLTSDINLRRECFRTGYNKCLEIYQFSAEDMIEFSDFVYRSQFDAEGYTQDIETKELLQLWQEQKTKTVRYE